MQKKTSMDPKKNRNGPDADPYVDPKKIVNGPGRGPIFGTFYLPVFLQLDWIRGAPAHREEHRDKRRE